MENIIRAQTRRQSCKGNLPCKELLNFPAHLVRRRPDAKLTGQGFIYFLTPEAVQEAFDALNGNVDFYIEFSCSNVPPDVLLFQETMGF